ncbi:hypothetical protein Pcinc_014286 [Petrolisthes cinctipes]|uniref:THAP-type domain-containing protein n=1 Tax=Petrolisthes cinctipes TaxID=88211 RepID=A0AAE1FVN0_PETCI|nr:hypothetical protein Pcinc_014286 [Petrolisthes cinctipes]
MRFRGNAVGRVGSPPPSPPGEFIRYGNRFGVGVKPILTPPLVLYRGNNHKMPRGSICRAKGCTSNKSDNPQLTFHSFPKNKERFKQWCELLQRPDLKHCYVLCHRTSMRVCSLHFEDTMYMSRTSTSRLVWNALPIPVKEQSSSSSSSTIEELGEENDNKAAAARIIKKLSADSKVSDYTLLRFKPPSTVSTKSKSSCVEMNCEDIIKEECVFEQELDTMDQQEHNLSQTNVDDDDSSSVLYKHCIDSKKGMNLYQSENNSCLEGENGEISLQNTHEGEKTSPFTCLEGGNSLPDTHRGDKTTSPVKCLEGVNGGNSLPNPLTGDKREKDISSCCKTCHCEKCKQHKTFLHRTYSGPIRRHTVKTKDGKLRTFMIINKTSLQTLQDKGLLQPLSKSGNQTISSAQCKKILASFQQPSKPPEKLAVSSDSSISYFPSVSSISPTPSVSTIQTHRATIQTSLANNQTSSPTNQIVKGATNQTSPNSNQITKVVSRSFTNQTSPNANQITLTTNQTNQVTENTSETTLATNQTKDASQTQTVTNQFIINTNLATVDTLDSILAINDTLRVTNQNNITPNMISNISPKPIRVTITSQDDSQDDIQDISQGDLQDIPQDTLQEISEDSLHDNSEKNSQDISEDIAHDDVQDNPQPKKKRTQNVRWVALPISPVQNSDPAVPTIIKATQESTTTQIDASIGKLLSDVTIVSPQRHKGGQKDSQSSSCRELKKRYLRLLNKHRRRYHLLLKKYKTMQTKVIESELEKDVKGSPQQLSGRLERCRGGEGCEAMLQASSSSR